MSIEHATGLALEPFAQSLREAHCSRGEGDHPCVGVVTISRDGVQLDCKLCGAETVPIAPSPRSDEVLVARTVLSVIGLEWNKLTAHAQRDVYDAIKRLDLVRRRGVP